MGIPTDDQETTITFSRNGENAVIWTSDSTVMTKLDKMAEKSSHYKVTDIAKNKGKVLSKTYDLDDKSLLSFRADKIKRDLTEEQRAELAERMKNARNSQGADDGQ